jgi:glucose/arabinose dehydrogenase
MKRRIRRRPRWVFLLALIAGLAVLVGMIPAGGAGAQSPEPTLEDPRLGVRTVVSGLVTPTSVAFLGPDDVLVLEKNTGKVQRVVNGSVAASVLDLAVNFGSERGLLGIALHPRFPADPGVYLFWTESTTGADTDVLDQTPLLGNRVDRFVWSGSSLTFDRNLVTLRAIQQDAFTITTPFGTFTQPERGNHDGGVLRFGPDGKLYVLFGDVGRRGQLQNLPEGPFGPGVPDDQFGGPEPDDEHLAGVILRLNDDGSTPGDNPFFDVGAEIGGEVGANVQKVFALRHPQQLRHGLRPQAGRPVDPGER